MYRTNPKPPNHYRNMLLNHPGVGVSPELACAALHEAGAEIDDSRVHDYADRFGGKISGARVLRWMDSPPSKLPKSVRAR